MARDSLIDFREKQGLTQQEMAQRIGISYAMYQAIEYGLRTPSVKTLNKMKTAFPRININQIFLA